MSEDDFDKAMHEIGVKPRGAGKRPPPRTAPASRQAPGERPPDAHPEPARPQGDGAARSAAAHALAAAELERLRAEAESLGARVAEIPKLQAEIESLRSELKSMASSRAELRAAVKRAGERAQILEAERDEARAAAESVPVADLLVLRGLEKGEIPAAITALLEHRRADLLAALRVADPRPMEALLADCLLLLGPDVEPPGAREVAVVRVPKERCELTGGSPLREVFHDFVEACGRAGVRRVTVVGGSPTYRAEIKELAEGHASAPQLTLVSGTTARPQRKAEADLRGSDLVILWGGTELDHSVSNQYAGPTVVRIAHRGLTCMLELAGLELAGRTVRG